MLENIRENSQGLVAKIILGFIILTFAVAGIGSYTNSVDTSVAEVNGVKISQVEFDKAYQNQRSNMAQQYGEMFETLAADENYMANFRNGVVDNLITSELLDQAADELAIRVSDETIKEYIREIPAFQIDGKFDNNTYLARINQMGYYQSSDFRDAVRVDMTRRQLALAVEGSEFSLPYQIEQLQALQNQKRDLKYATISAKQFEETIDVSEEEINNYYQANQVNFQNEEKIKLDYITIDVNEIAKTIDVSEQDIENYYNDNIANYRQLEQRRVSHILIETGEDNDAAKAQIAEIKSSIDSGEDFAELAKEHSADIFSGENGGDLDWIERGSMDEAFDDAAFNLVNVGDVSDVVETEFGYHLIKLTDLKEEQTKPLAEVNDELRVTVSTEQAQNKFFELQQQAAQLSFEIPDSLDDAAHAVGVEVKTTDWLTRNGNTAPFDNFKVIDAAFSDLVRQERLNSDLIEVNDSLAMVVRLNDYQPANVKPLAEVSDEIKSLLVAEKAQQQAQTAAEELVAALQAGENVDAKLAELNATFEEKQDVARFGSQLDANLVREAFKLPHPVADSVSVSSVAQLNGDLAVVEVTAVTAGEAAESSPRLAQQLTQQVAQLAFRGYVETLKADAEIKRSSSIQATNQY